MVLQPPWRAPCTQILLSLIWWPVTGTLASQARDYSGGDGWEAWEASHAKVCPPRCRDLCTHHQLTWATSCAAPGGGEMRPGSQLAQPNLASSTGQAGLRERPEVSTGSQKTKVQGRE